MAGTRPELAGQYFHGLGEVGCYGHMSHFCLDAFREQKADSTDQAKGASGKSWKEGLE
ncbi:hypothetical protein NBRC116584_03470 [Hydrogenophaga sp. 5NK40-0174]